MNSTKCICLRIVREAYLKAYGDCLDHIATSMKTRGKGSLSFCYDKTEPRCYNVNNVSGDSDVNTVTGVRLDESGLVLVCDNGSEFPCGTDANGQDNYTIVNPDVLINKVVEGLEKS